MKQLDFTLVDQIDRHKQERAAAEWQAKVNKAKEAGTNMAHIEFWAITIIAVILAFMLETPH